LGFDPANLAILSFTWTLNPSLGGGIGAMPPEAAKMSFAERVALGRSTGERRTVERNTDGLARAPTLERTITSLHTRSPPDPAGREAPVDALTPNWCVSPLTGIGA
jgi:hypothetical protein